MVAEATGRIARRTDDKYFLYLPKHLVEDSAYPFERESSVAVRVLIDPDGEKLLVMPLKGSQPRHAKKR
jgi:hypothetical protein